MFCFKVCQNLRVSMAKVSRIFYKPVYLDMLILKRDAMNSTSCYDSSGFSCENSLYESIISILPSS